MFFAKYGPGSTKSRPKNTPLYILGLYMGGPFRGKGMSRGGIFVKKWHFLTFFKKKAFFLKNPASWTCKKHEVGPISGPAFIPRGGIKGRKHKEMEIINYELNFWAEGAEFS